MNGLGQNGTGPCRACGLYADAELNTIPLGGAPDPCLGIVPGCFQACCGHGNPEQAYVCIAEGVEPGTQCWTVEHRTLRGPDALAWLRARAEPCVQANLDGKARK